MVTTEPGIKHRELAAPAAASHAHEYTARSPRRGSTDLLPMTVGGSSNDHAQESTNSRRSLGEGTNTEANHTAVATEPGEHGASCHILDVRKVLSIEFTGVGLVVTIDILGAAVNATGDTVCKHARARVGGDTPVERLQVKEAFWSIDAVTVAAVAIVPAIGPAASGTMPSRARRLTSASAAMRGSGGGSRL